MDAIAAQIEVAQLGLAQRAQKYLDTAALTLVESVARPAAQQLAAPAATAIPVEPVQAAPRDGTTVHVVA
jgi:hypothetical protein